MKYYFILLFALFCSNAFSQMDTSKSSLSFTGYAEVYYAYDFNQPADHNRPSFFYSHNRHNEFNLNLGFVKTSYTTDRVRANVALAAGTYMNANYSSEPGVLKNIYEANAGVKLCEKKNLWIDGGIFASHIGFESAVSKDCWGLTRSILADNSPYYESGAKISYTSDNSKWFFSGLILNGWQHIQRPEGNNTPSFGAQITYTPNSDVTINYSNFIGNDKPDTVKRMRYFHNFYGMFHINDKFHITAGFDYGMEQKFEGSSEYYNWYSPVLIVKVILNDKWSITGRGEYYADKNGVIIPTGTENGFQTFGYSLNFDYRIRENAVWRVEGRTLNSKDKIFIKGSDVLNTDTFVTTSIAISFLMSEEDNKEQNVERFLDLIRKSRRGKFKIYIGMSAGVGKTYRMLQEAHSLLKNGINIKVGYIETHNRKETHDLLEGLPVIPRRKLFYKGKELEELDVQAIVNVHPEVVIVDELAHTNIEGSKNEKRWQDVLDILNAGINVISAVNIQHIEGLNEEIQKITGIEVKERIPDKVLGLADEVVNIDLTADELITRLKEGKIYHAEKIETALKNFFKSEHILQLRELALKEVASQVERKIESELPRSVALRHEKFLGCISSNDETSKMIIRKTARLASYYNSKWYILYVQTEKEHADRIGLASQRHLINNFKMATEMGAEVIRVQNNNIAKVIIETAEQKEITTICIGKPHFSLLQIILSTNIFNQLLNKLSASDIDLVILS